MIKGNKSYTYLKNLHSIKLNLKAIVDILKLPNCNEFLVFFDYNEPDLKWLDIFKDCQVYYDNFGNIECALIPSSLIDILNTINDDCDLCIISSSKNETYDKLIRKMNYLNPRKLIKNNEIYFMIEYNYSEEYVAFYFNIRNYDLDYVKSKIDNLF